MSRDALNCLTVNGDQINMMWKKRKSSLFTNLASSSYHVISKSYIFRFFLLIMTRLNYTGRSLCGFFSTVLIRYKLFFLRLS